MPRARTELVHCDNCGEDYAATYRRCPFCNAKAGQRPDDYGEADYGDYDDAPRRGGKRLAGGSPGGGDPAKIAIYVLAALVILAVICVLISVVIPKLVAPAPSAQPSASVSAAPSQKAESSQNIPDAETSAGNGEGVMSFHPLPVIDGSGNVESTAPSASAQPSAQPSAAATPVPTAAASQAPSGGAKLSSTDFTISAAYPDPIRLRVSGGEAVSWRSQDESVATVSSNGTVTGVGNGNTRIVCTLADGSTLSCTVHVAGIGVSASQAPASQAPASQAPSGDAKLTYGGQAVSEFSITARHPEPITLKVQGGTASSWRSLNTNVASVSDNGTVSGVGSGNTTVECTLTDGSVLRCTVHVDGL